MTPWFNRIPWKAGRGRGLMQDQGSKRALAWRWTETGAGLARSQNWAQCTRWRNPPQRLLYRATPVRGDKLPEFAIRKSRDNVAFSSGGGRPDEACTTLETPITGGNVSLYNETLGEGIYHAGDRYRRNVEKRGRRMTFHFRRRP